MMDENFIWQQIFFRVPAEIKRNSVVWSCATLSDMFCQWWRIPQVGIRAADDAGSGYQILWIYDGVATAKIASMGWTFLSTCMRGEGWTRRLTIGGLCLTDDGPLGGYHGPEGAADCSSVFLESFVKIWSSLWRPRFGAISGMFDISSVPSI